MKFFFLDRKIFVSMIAAVLIIALAIGYFLMIWMPGSSYRQALEPLNAEEVQLKERLRSNVQMLASTIGPRNDQNPESLQKAAKFIETELQNVGYTVRRQRYEVKGKVYENLEAEIKGSDRPDQIILIGAHYDSVPGSPGANDNASGTAALIEITKSFSRSKPARTLRFVAFVNEEQPFAGTDNMGSVVYAKAAKAKDETIMAMMSLEGLGYYSNEPGSQRYPTPLNWLYPSTGNFIAIVGNLDSRKVVRTTIHDFRLKAKVASEGAALPEMIRDIGRSDHRSFWQAGYPAIMVTDTSVFRDPNYHQSSDRPENLDYDRLALVTDGLAKVIADFVGI